MADWRDTVKRVWIIGGGVPSFDFDCVISEDHTSELKIMDNPVETGFVISDHAVMMPVTLEISAVVSDVWLLMRGLTAHGTDRGPLATDKPWLVPPAEDNESTTRSRRAWELLRGLQQSANPFSVQTGFELYENMLCQRITANQDKRTAGCLIFRATLREILVTSTETVTYPPRADKSTTLDASKKTTKGQQQAAEPAKEKQASTLFRGGQAIGWIP